MTESIPNPASHPRSGYTLPVFACAAAIAALHHLNETERSLSSVDLDLLEPAQTVAIAIEQVARLGETAALAITRSDPGDNLDLTRNTPIWAMVEVLEREGGDEEGGGGKGDEGDGEDRGDERSRTGYRGEGQSPVPSDHSQILIRYPASLIWLRAGEGWGRQVHAHYQPSISQYARRLFQDNLERWLKPGQNLRVTIILPEGRALADRTSNAAFGVVEGLSLLGTTGISQPLSAPGQLELFREAVQQKAEQYRSVVFCVGENGVSLAQQLGIPGDRILKTANWLGPLLVEASLQGIESILLFGYHGKLIKLAGGIFHTHHQVADARQEIFVAHCAQLGLPHGDIRHLFACSTVEAGLMYLRQLDVDQGTQWVEQVYGAIAQKIDDRTQAYIQDHSDRHVTVGTVLFDRHRQIIVQSKTGATLLSQGLLS